MPNEISPNDNADACHLTGLVALRRWSCRYAKEQANLPPTAHLDPIYHLAYHMLQRVLSRAAGGISDFPGVRLLSDKAFHFMPLTYLAGRVENYAAPLPRCTSRRRVGRILKVSHLERKFTDPLLHRPGSYSNTSLFGWVAASRGNSHGGGEDASHPPHTSCIDDSPFGFCTSSSNCTL